MPRCIVRFVCLTGLVALVSAPHGIAAKRRPLELHNVELELPGAPSSVIATDLNRDGRQDLFVIVAYTELENIGVDRIEDMVQISTVIPALFDRREARVYLGQEDASYVLAGKLEIPPSVLSVAKGPPGFPLLALTDEGAANIRFVETAAGDVAPLVLEPLISDRPVLAGSGAFFPRLKWVVDLDGDGFRDLLFPSIEGPSVYRYRDGRLETEPAQRLSLPGDRRRSAGRSYPLLRTEDADGDGRPDLIHSGGDEIHLFSGNGDGTFRPVHPDAEGCAAARSAVRLGDHASHIEHLAYFGDLDGDGRAEAVIQELLESGKDGLRAGLKEAKRPHQSFRIHRLREDLSLDEVPGAEFEVVGHSFSADLPGAFFHQFLDLDADGRKELITITLNFSIFQALKVLISKRMGIGLDFHVWQQDENGAFSKVNGLDLSEKLRLNFKKMTIPRLAQFAGDFDGDGLIDFVHFGRGKRITIHSGRPGARYPVKPDLVIELEEEPPAMGLIRVEDLDGDGRADISITRPRPVKRESVSPPVVLDLYLSGADDVQ